MSAVDAVKGALPGAFLLCGVLLVIYSKYRKATKTSLPYRRWTHCEMDRHHVYAKGLADPGSVFLHDRFYMDAIGRWEMVVTSISQRGDEWEWEAQDVESFEHEHRYV